MTTEASPPPARGNSATAGEIRITALVDNRALRLRSGRGLVVCIGCSHAGLVNTLEHARRLSGESAILAVLGGFHLLQADRGRLDRTLEALACLSPGLLAPGHCTGAPAVRALRERFPDRIPSLRGRQDLSVLRRAPPDAAFFLPRQREGVVSSIGPDPFRRTLMNRRQFLFGASAAALGLGTSPAFRVPGPRRRILFFIKSSGFEHSVVKEKDGQPSHFEKVTREGILPLAAKAGHSWEITFSKDGSLFTPQGIAAYDAFVFYTSGDLTKEGTDKKPPMSPEGKEAFLEAIRKGKGFVGVHAATDSFRGAKGGRPDPYLEMIGAEFTGHGAQQKARMTCADPKFPGMAGARDGFEWNEEWYTHRFYARDLHVLLVQETAGMKGDLYQRPPYPATWARMHGQGRVFYTSLGHREDVMTQPLFQEILVGGIAWAAGDLKAEVAPNMEKVTPGAFEMPAPKKK